MPGRVCRHYPGSATTRAEGTDRHMEPDREDRSAGPACLRETQLRETRLRDEWRRRSLATGWRMPDDWESEASASAVSATMLSQSPRLDRDSAIHRRRNGLIDRTPGSRA